MYNPPPSFTDKFYDHKGKADYESIERILCQINNEGRRKYLRENLKHVPDLDYVIAQYNGAIAYADHGVGRVLNLIKEANLSEKTLIVLTSDHGESLTEHKIFFDHHGLYDVSLHVPLILKSPGLPKGKRVKGLVQHIDLVPSILDILNIQVPEEKTFDGKNFMPLINSQAKELRSSIFVEEAYYQRKRAIRTKKYKYIQALSEKGAKCRSCQLIHGGFEELYDLNEDPQETINIIKKKPAVRDSLSEKLQNWEKNYEKRDTLEKWEKTASFSSDEEKEILERLKKLGYF
jgi:arylsulfatase A-like enzyme